MSTLNEYQLEAGKTNKGTATYTSVVVGENAEWRLIQGMYNAHGLCGEAGETAEKVKKYARDGGDYLIVRLAVQKELGDVLWYLSQLARDFGLTLQDVADCNLAKLRDRSNRGVLAGYGDNR